MFCAAQRYVVTTIRRAAACCGEGYWLRHNLKVSLHRNKPLRGVLYSILNVKHQRGGHSQSRSSLRQAQDMRQTPYKQQSPTRVGFVVCKN
jgi:hypothetical protein